MGLRKTLGVYLSVREPLDPASRALVLRLLEEGTELEAVREYRRSTGACPPRGKGPAERSPIPVIR